MMMRGTDEVQTPAGIPLDLCMNSCTAIIYSVYDVTSRYHYSFSLTNCVPSNLDEFRSYVLIFMSQKSYALMK